MKIGWSARQKGEYQHRAPRALVTRVGRSLSQIQKRRLFRIEQIQMTSAEPSRERPPLYQVYVVVAWLKEIGAIQQVGRQGYAVVDAHNLPARIDEAWQQLESN